MLGNQQDTDWNTPQSAQFFTIVPPAYSSLESLVQSASAVNWSYSCKKLQSRGKVYEELWWKAAYRWHSWSACCRSSRWEVVVSTLGWRKHLKAAQDEQRVENWSAWTSILTWMSILTVDTASQLPIRLNCPFCACIKFAENCTRPSNTWVFVAASHEEIWVR